MSVQRNRDQSNPPARDLAPLLAAMVEECDRAPGGDVQSDPCDWPAWCDSFYYEATGPDPDDAAWAMEAFNQGTTDYDLAEEFEEFDESGAAESAALDRLERCLIPLDVALAINATSLVGLADEMADAYADEAGRISGHRPDRDQASANVSLSWFRLAGGR